MRLQSIVVYSLTSAIQHVTWRAWPLSMQAMAAMAIASMIVEAALQAARLWLPQGLLLRVKSVHLGS